jgi:hypothetical protein
MGRLFLSCAAACVASGSALAASSMFVVNKYVTVQPITVCATNGSGCAQVNDGSAAIGFLNPNISPNDDTADEIISKELVDIHGNATRVTFLPLQSFSSPINSLTGTTWQTLHFTSGSATPDCNNLTSTDFNTLTQWPFPVVSPPGTSPPVYTVPNPTTPGPTKACKISNGVLQPTCVPISTTPTTINMFFVSGMMITSHGCGATLTGFSQIDGNGVAINSPAVFNNSLIDVIPHEIMHVLSLPHICSTSCTTSNDTNLMAPGGVRTAPTTSNLAPDLTGGTEDQLTSTQTAAVLDPSGFLNLILEVTATIKADPVANTFDFTVSIPGKNTGASTSVISLVWEVAPPLGFSNPSFTVTNNPDGLNVTGALFNGDLGNGGATILCGSSSIKCFRVDITPPPAFVAGDTLSFSLAISNSNKNTTLSDLNGSTFTFLTSDEFATTSAFEFGKSMSNLTADSLMPAFNIASFINDPNSFAPLTQTPCKVSNTGQCPNVTVVDGL